MRTQYRPWSAAMAAALHEPAGFYARPEGPAGHFRTSVTASPLFAAALLRLATQVDAVLGHPEIFDLVDVGAGHGILLATVAELAPATAAELAPRLRLTAVEPSAVEPSAPSASRQRWLSTVAELPAVTGLLVGNEWLDTVPVDVVQQTRRGPRLVLVDGAGRERLGPPPTTGDTEWLARWWPLPSEPGARAEIGRRRDDAWADAVAAVVAGAAVAIDYATKPEERSALALAGGTLAGYRAGRAVLPVPDGSTDVTAHVALDACAAAATSRASAAGRRIKTLLTEQRSVLRALGVRGTRPPRERAGRDPVGYLGALRDAGQAAELTAPGGLGDFGWLVQSVSAPLPPTLAALAVAARP